MAFANPLDPSGKSHPRIMGATGANPVPVDGKLREQIARALNLAGWTCFEGSHEPGNYDICGHCKRVDLQMADAILPVVSAAVAEAWDEGDTACARWSAALLVDHTAPAPVNPYRTPKEG